VDFNRIGLVQTNLGWTWPVWPIGPAHRLTSPGSTTPLDLPSPHSHTRQTLTLIVPLALVIASRRRRCCTIPVNLDVGCWRHEGQSVRHPGLRHLTEGNPLPWPLSPAASLLLLSSGRRSVPVPPFTKGTRLASPPRASLRAPFFWPIPFPLYHDHVASSTWLAGVLQRACASGRGSLVDYLLRLSSSSTAPSRSLGLMVLVR
jgi:hypothetical protein